MVIFFALAAWASVAFSFWEARMWRCSSFWVCDNVDLACSYYPLYGSQCQHITGWKEFLALGSESRIIHKGRHMSSRHHREARRGILRNLTLETRPVPLKGACAKFLALFGLRSSGQTMVSE